MPSYQVLHQTSQPHSEPGLLSVRVQIIEAALDLCCGGRAALVRQFQEAGKDATGECFRVSLHFRCSLKGTVMTLELTEISGTVPRLTDPFISVVQPGTISQ